MDTVTGRRRVLLGQHIESFRLYKEFCMKNILILAAILFVASFSFVGCSDDPVESITGPTPIAGPKGDKGETGPKGDQGKDGATGVSELLDLNSGEHADVCYDLDGRSYDPDGIQNVICSCVDGYHIVSGSQSNTCRTTNGHYDYYGYDESNKDMFGCLKPEYWVLDPDGDGWLDDQGCFPPSSGLQKAYNTVL